jgi:MSHA biogenesis protein MshQ
MNLMTLGRHWRTAPVAACLVVFLTASRVHAAGWYDAAWSSRKKITIDSAQVMATLTDFPFMVSMTDADLQAGAQADGDDILFTDDDGTTKLDHDIEVWEDSSGNLVAWVRIPTLPDTVDKEIYLYYGNSSATDQRNATGVWVNYVGVWHLNETSGTRYDSTSNGNHLTDQNTVAYVPGKIGGCADFEESASERLYITDAAQTNLDITGNLTMQAWVKPESVPGSVTFLDKYAGSNAGYRMRIHSNSWFEYSVYDGSTNEVRSPVPVNPPDTWPPDTWYFLVGVYDGSDVIIYTDAADPDTISHSGGISTNSEDFEIGARGNDKFYDGLIDEVRIATVPRTLEWVQTEFNNQSSADFYQRSPTGPTPSTS